MKYIGIIGFALLFLTACAKKKAEKQAVEDDAIIQQYITDNSLLATKLGSGLYYVIDNPGTGASCNSTSDVTVAYKGNLPNGTVFDESGPDGITFNLQGVIQGWTLGIPYFKEGGNGMLLIPSALGYGTRAVGSIPKNSVLIFEVSLIEVL